MGAGGEAGLRARGLDRGAVHHGRMALGGHRLLRRQNLTADGAVRSLGEARFGARGLDSRLVNHNCMSLRRKHLLRNEHVAADGAVVPSGQAVLRARGLHSLVGDVGMSAQRGYGLLRNDYIAADGAVRALGEAVLNACRFHAGIGNHGMAGLRDDFLGEEHLTAAGAVKALGQARREARGGNGRVNDIDMPRGEIDDFVRELSAASRAHGDHLRLTAELALILIGDSNKCVLARLAALREVAGRPGRVYPGAGLVEVGRVARRARAALEPRAAVEHVDGLGAGLGREGCRRVNRGERRAAVEHAGHVRDPGRVEGRQVEGGERLAAVEHA